MNNEERDLTPTEVTEAECAPDIEVECIRHVARALDHLQNDTRSQPRSLRRVLVWAVDRYLEGAKLQHPHSPLKTAPPEKPF